jgi:hypothetical protein
MQIGQAAGGLSEGGYCVPQVEQMKAGIGEGYTASSAVFQRLERVCHIYLVVACDTERLRSIRLG